MQPAAAVHIKREPTNAFRAAHRRSSLRVSRALRRHIPGRAVQDPPLRSAAGFAPHHVHAATDLGVPRLPEESASDFLAHCMDRDLVPGEVQRRLRDATRTRYRDRSPRVDPAASAIEPSSFGHPRGFVVLASLISIGHTRRCPRLACVVKLLNYIL